MMNNRIDDLLPPDDSAIVPVFREPSSREDLKEYKALVKQWAYQHPVPCLATAFALGALVAWFVKRR